MFQKTDSSEFAPGFLWQLVLLTAIVLLLVLFTDSLFKSDFHRFAEPPRIVLFPWVLAGGHTIENGLHAFAGKPAEPMNAKNQVVTLIGLLVVSVICPTIFLLRWRRKKLASPTSRESATWRITRVLYGVCSALVVYMTAMILPIVLYGAVSHYRLREAQAVQSSRDAIINELCSIAVDLSQYYALPKEYDGGNHSYDGYKLTEGASKTAEASYSVTPNAKEVVIRAESIRYTSSWVKAKVDSTGELRSWSYGGKFQ